MTMKNRIYVLAHMLTIFLLSDAINGVTFDDFTTGSAISAQIFGTGEDSTEDDLFSSPLAEEFTTRELFVDNNDTAHEGRLEMTVDTERGYLTLYSENPQLDGKSFATVRYPVQETAANLTSYNVFRLHLSAEEEPTVVPLDGPTGASQNTRPIIEALMIACEFQFETTSRRQSTMVYALKSDTTQVVEFNFQQYAALRETVQEIRITFYSYLLPSSDSHGLVLVDLLEFDTPSPKSCTNGDLGQYFLPAIINPGHPEDSFDSLCRCDSGYSGAYCVNQSTCDEWGVSTGNKGGNENDDNMVVNVALNGPEFSVSVDTQVYNKRFTTISLGDKDELPYVESVIACQYPFGQWKKVNSNCTDTISHEAPLTEMLSLCGWDYRYAVDPETDKLTHFYSNTLFIEHNDLIPYRPGVDAEKVTIVRYPITVKAPAEISAETGVVTIDDSNVLYAIITRVDHNFAENYVNVSIRTAIGNDMVINPIEVEHTFDEEGEEIYTVTDLVPIGFPDCETPEEGCEQEFFFVIYYQDTRNADACDFDGDVLHTVEFDCAFIGIDETRQTPCSDIDDIGKNTTIVLNFDVDACGEAILENTLTGTLTAYSNTALTDKTSTFAVDETVYFDFNVDSASLVMESVELTLVELVSDDETRELYPSLAGDIGTVSFSKQDALAVNAYITSLGDLRFQFDTTSELAFLFLNTLIVRAEASVTYLDLASNKRTTTTIRADVDTFQSTVELQLMAGNAIGGQTVEDGDMMEESSASLLVPFSW